MTTLHKVSHSEAETWLSCRRKHYYAYIKGGAGLKPVSTAAALSRGSFVHALLETYYSFILEAGATNKEQREAHKDAVAAARQHYEDALAGKNDREVYVDEVPANRRTVDEALFEFYFPNESLVRAGWTILAVEYSISLEIDLGNGEIYQYPFVIDLIALDPKGKTVIIDHKYVWDFYSGEDVDLLSQLPKYLAGLRAGDFPADYAAYNLIRNRSKKNAQVEDVLRFMPSKPTAHQVQDIFTEQVSVATEIIGLKELGEEAAEQVAYRSASTITCQNCDFSNICRTERVGGDIGPILAIDYTKREDKPFEADLIIN